MSEDLALLLDLSRDGLAAGFLVFLRIGAAMALLPAFSSQAIPARIRLGLALAFTLIVTPAVLPLLRETGEFGISAAAAEVMIGVAIGIVLRLFVTALEIAGTIIAQATSLAQLFGGVSGEPQPAVGQLLVMAGLALALMAGLHVKLASALIGSYAAMPPGVFPAPADIRAWGVAGVAQAFAMAFTLAAPFVIAGLVYNAALGAINRAMPQLMVAFIGAPALTAGGLALLAIVVPMGLHVWHEAFTLFLSDPYGAAR